jgi:hypothetical protein
VTVVDRAVCLVEEAGTVQQIAQTRAFESVFAPFDLGRRTAPGFPLEDRPVTLGELPVETGIVSDNDYSVRYERSDLGFIDPSSCNQFVRDASQRGYLG